MAVVLALLLTTACTNASGAPWETEDQLKAVDGQIWVVGDRLVTISTEAAMQLSVPPVGSTIHVSGVRTSRGELLVDTVELVTRPATQSAPAHPTPRAQPTPPRAPTPAKKPHRGDEDD